MAVAKTLALWVLAAVSLAGVGVHAQPSPEVQKRISAAIKKAGESNSTEIDYTQFVNVFIGTDNFGDVWYASSRPRTHAPLNFTLLMNDSPPYREALARLCPLAWCVMRIFA